jgi:hypothetical protein
MLRMSPDVNWKFSLLRTTNCLRFIEHSKARRTDESREPMMTWERHWQLKSAVGWARAQVRCARTINLFGAGPTK